MKILLLFFLLYSTDAFPQKISGGGRKSITQIDTIPDFNTAGEQEIYNVKKLFKEKYNKQKHKRFSGRLSVLSSTTFKFDNKIIEANFTSDDLKAIFVEGLLYPDLFGESDSLRITDLQELEYVRSGATSKRFSLWVFEKVLDDAWLANPQVFYIELTNIVNPSSKDLKEFIKGASLTYFKRGGIIL